MAAKKRASAAPSDQARGTPRRDDRDHPRARPDAAGELADAIVERGRYTVPRSGKPLDAKTVSQRVSNPTYRSRFVRTRDASAWPRSRAPVGPQPLGLARSVLEDERHQDVGLELERTRHGSPSLAAP